MADEKRRNARGRTLLGGILIFSASHFTVDCTVRNLGVDGARVRFPESVTLSVPISLLVLQTGQAFDAEVIWNRGAEAGLRFVRALDLEGETPRARLVRRLWLERRAR